MFLEISELFLIEKYDVSWGDFLEFLELVFNTERWCGMRWCGMLVEFLELFFNREMWHGMR
jgi:hypothetical protein